MTDGCTNIALVLIVISKNDVIGRISIPLSFTKLKCTAKQLGDEFCLKFKGKCIHNGTRLEASVTDFQLECSQVNDDSLRDVFKHFESLFSNKL